MQVDIDHETILQILITSQVKCHFEVRRTGQQSKMIIYGETQPIHHNEQILQQDNDHVTHDTTFQA